MRAQFSVDRANCEWCMRDTTRALLERPNVTSVETKAVPGCIIVDHDGDDPAALGAVIDRVLHGFETASNGEVIMTTTSVARRSRCPHHQRPAYP